MTTAEIESGAAPEASPPDHNDHGAHEEHHPLPYQYVLVAVFLAFLTGSEVGLYYVKMNRRLFTVILLVMMIVKFATVAAWFMHLRFDSRIFRRLFVTGIILASTVYFIALLSLHVSLIR